MASGLGLGLSSVRRIVALYGGRSRVSDRNDGGTIFCNGLLRRCVVKSETAPSETLGAVSNSLRTPAAVGHRDRSGQSP
jgi:hypothetical protein